MKHIENLSERLNSDISSTATTTTIIMLEIIDFLTYALLNIG